MASVVQVHHDGPVCRIVLDRPDKLNALNEAVRVELHAAIGDLAADPTTRVAVLDGAGRAFSAGFDIVEGIDLPEAWAERRHAAGGWQRLADDLERLPQVTVAALHGPVVGGAVVLAAACDLRVAADDVTLSIPELAIGIPLSWSGVPRLVREVGLPLARDLVLTGRRLDASELRDSGFAQRLVPAGDLDAAVDEVVAELLAMPAGPLQLTKAALRAAEGGPRASGWADADLLAAALDRPEYREAARRYLGSRLRRDPG